MREIKFRAWDKRELRWLENHEFQIKPDGFISTFGIFPSSKSLELMQYTGLKDKNGKEIYEGDVFDFRGDMGKVEYCDEGAYELISREGSFITHLCFVKPEDIEIIGNIYENPELLQEGKDDSTRDY